MSAEPITELVLTIPNERELAPNTLSVLQTAYAPYFAQAVALTHEAQQITVTDESDKAGMARARETRLAIKKVRTDAEKTRKELKEESLRMGKAIDGANNLLLAHIKPVEDRLLEMEMYAELAEARRKEQLAEDRKNALIHFVDDVTVYDLANMTQPAFDSLLEGQKLARQAKIDAERKAEEERIAREKADAEERERVRQENERLKAEAEAREKAMAEERAKAEAERKKAEAERARIERDAQAERDKIEAQAKAAREKAAREAKAERDRLEAQLRAEREARAKAEAAERAAKAKADAELKAAQDAKAKEERAPDKEKIMAYVERLRTCPSEKMKTKEAHSLICAAEQKILDVCDWIEAEANNL